MLGICQGDHTQEASRSKYRIVLIIRALCKFGPEVGQLGRAWFCLPLFSSIATLLFVFAKSVSPSFPPLHINRKIVNNKPLTLILVVQEVHATVKLTIRNSYDPSVTPQKQSALSTLSH